MRSSTSTAGDLSPRGQLISDRTWVRGQYKSSSNLSARATLHIRFRTNDYPWQRWVFDHLRAPHAANILELGGGPGPLWRENYDRIPVGWRIWLTDLSAGMVQEAAEGLQQVPEEGGLRTLQWGKDFAAGVVDAQALPYPDAAFDAIVANHMLYHVPDVAACLAEVQRVLRPGGRFYAATNGRGHMRELHDFVRAFEPTFPEDHWGHKVFDIEGGHATLPDYFAQVTFHRHPGGLRVTEPAPLAAYVLSGILDDSDPQYVARFRRYVIDRLAADGPLHITTETGLFEAIKQASKR